MLIVPVGKPHKNIAFYFLFIPFREKHACLMKN